MNTALCVHFSHWRYVYKSLTFGTQLEQLMQMLRNKGSTTLPIFKSNNLKYNSGVSQRIQPVASSRKSEHSFLGTK